MKQASFQWEIKLKSSHYSEMSLRFYSRNWGSQVCHREKFKSQKQTENVNWGSPFSSQTEYYGYENLATSQCWQERLCHAAGEYGWMWLRATGPVLQGCPWGCQVGVQVLELFEDLCKTTAPCIHTRLVQPHPHFQTVSHSLIMNFGQSLHERCFIISCKVLSDSTEGFMMPLMKDPWLCKNLSWLVKSAAVGMISVDLFPLLNSNYLQISFQGTAYRLKDRRNVTQNISVEDFPQKTNHLGF